MKTITIYGPIGSGKSRLGEMLKRLLMASGKTSYLLESGDAAFNFDYVIETKFSSKSRVEFSDPMDLLRMVEILEQV